MKAALQAGAALLLALLAGCASRPAAPVAPTFSEEPLVAQRG